MGEPGRGGGAGDRGARAGEVGKATAELEAMRGDGIEADRYSYNGLLTAHANAKPAPDAAAARGALSAMEAAAAIARE